MLRRRIEMKLRMLLEKITFDLEEEKELRMRWGCREPQRALDVDEELCAYFID
jgi:hypothetical protein